MIRVLALGAIVWLIAVPASAQIIHILNGLGLGEQSGLGDAEIASGLKEALQIGTENAVNLTGRPDG